MTDQRSVSGTSELLSKLLGMPSPPNWLNRPVTSPSWKTVRLPSALMFAQPPARPNAPLLKVELKPTEDSKQSGVPLPLMSGPSLKPISPGATTPPGEDSENTGLVARKRLGALLARSISACSAAVGVTPASVKIASKSSDPGVGMRKPDGKPFAPTAKKLEKLGVSAALNSPLWKNKAGLP